MHIEKLGFLAARMVLGKYKTCIVLLTYYAPSELH